MADPSECLQVVGSALTALGILLTLFGLRRVRSAVSRALRRLAPLSVALGLLDSKDALIAPEAVRARVTIPSPTLRVRRSTAAMVLERLAELEENVAKKHSALRAELAESAARGAAELGSISEEWEAASATGESWTLAGLVVALVGAVLSSVAPFV